MSPRAFAETNLIIIQRIQEKRDGWCGRKGTGLCCVCYGQNNSSDTANFVEMTADHV